MTNQPMIRKSFKAALTLLVLSSVVSSIVSCGDGESRMGGSTPNNLVKITSSNVDNIISETGNAEASISSSTELTDNLNSNSSSLSPRQQQSFTGLSELNQQKTGISALAVGTCPDGGSYSTPDDSSGIGDYIYDNCQYSFFGSNIGIDGTISITGTGNIGGNFFDGSYFYDNLSWSINDIEYIYHGTINVAWNITDLSTTMDYDVPEFTITWSDGNIKMSDYVVNYEKDVAANEESWYYQYTISSTLLNGAVQVATPDLLIKTIGKTYPYQGQLKWSGDNSSAMLTVNESGVGDPTDTVTIEVDEDGDGVYEYQKNIMWQDLN